MTDRDDIDLLAAEYVLGTLDAEQVAQVARRAATDAALADAILVWQERLAPLAGLVDDAPEPPGLWRDILHAVRSQPRDNRARPSDRWPISSGRRTARRPGGGVVRRIWSSTGLWRAAALVALVAAAAPWVAREAPRPQPGPLGVATLIAPGETAPAAVATVAEDGGLLVRPVRPVTVPAGHSLALWALPQGATSPVLLGALAAEGGLRDSPALPNGSIVMVTSEPPNGHAPNTPPGPTVLLGVVARWPAAS